MLAEAEAKATDMVSNAINKGSVQAINYFLGLQIHRGACKRIASAPNQKVILMPLEASNVIGALGGIAELAKVPWATRPPPRARRTSVPPQS